jgi:hypothetical protein
MIKTSKVVSCSEWTPPNPDKFGNKYYDVEFENNDVGVHKTSKPFEEGAIVTYEITQEKWKNGKKYYKIKRAKDQEYATKKIEWGNPQQIKRHSFNDPEDTKDIAMSVAQSAAVDIYIFYKELATHRPINDFEYSSADIDDLSLSLYHWIIAEGVKDRAPVSIRWNAILRAVKQLELIPAKDISFDKEVFSEIIFKFGDHSIKQLRNKDNE